MVCPDLRPLRWIRFSMAAWQALLRDKDTRSCCSRQACEICRANGRRERLRTLIKFIHLPSHQHQHHHNVIVCPSLLSDPALIICPCVETADVFRSALVLCLTQIKVSSKVLCCH